MTGVRITIDDDGVNAVLARVERAGVDTQPLMEEIAAAMLLSTQRRFETQTDPDGTPWQRLQPRTAARRVNRKGIRRGFDNILRVSNRLYSSITGEASANQAAVGTNVVYGAAHQFGAQISKPGRAATVIHEVHGRKGEKRLGRFSRRDRHRAIERDVTIGAHTVTIPARPWLGFSREDRDEIRAIVQDFYEAAAGATA